jgi:hypothetical protein
MTGWNLPNELAVGICNPRSEERDGNYTLVLARSRTLVFHTIAVAPSDVKVIILQVSHYLFIYLFIYILWIRSLYQRIKRLLVGRSISRNLRWSNWNGHSKSGIVPLDWRKWEKLPRTQIRIAGLLAATQISTTAVFKEEVEGHLSRRRRRN